MESVKYLNRNTIILFLILVISAIFRYLILDDPNGLWYDELVSYKEASAPNILFLIFYTLKTDIHLPLYPLLLHLWGKIFSFSDFALREFSAICGLITVFVSYLVGKELKSKQTGLICASVFCVNSFLIFYSQEVRMYSFLTLFSTIYLFSIIRIKNKFRDKKNYFINVLSALAILNSCIFGFIFYFFQTVSFLIYVLISFKEEKLKVLKRFLILNCIISVLTAPIVYYLFINKNHYIKQINGYYFDWSSLFVIVQNWFSPVLNGLFNNPRHYIDFLVKNFNAEIFVFILLPIALSIFFIINALRKDKFSWVLLSASLFFIVVEIIAVKYTNFKLLARYTVLSFPNILVLVAYGLSQIENKNLKKFLLITFLGINIFYLVVKTDSAFRITRHGYRPLAYVLNSSGLNDNDFIVVWNRQEVLDKYVHKKLNVVSLLRNIAYTSDVILQNEDYLSKLPLNERKKFLRANFIDQTLPHNTLFLMNSIYNHLKPGQKFIITTTERFDSFTKASFVKLVQNDKQYSEISLNDLLTIQSVLDAKYFCYQHFKSVKKIKKDQYIVIIFEK